MPVHDVLLIEDVIKVDGEVTMAISDLRRELEFVGLHEKWKACELLAWHDSEFAENRADLSVYALKRNNLFLRAIRDQLEIEPLLAVAGLTMEDYEPK